MYYLIYLTVSFIIQALLFDVLVDNIVLKRLVDLMPKAREKNIHTLDTLYFHTQPDSKLIQTVLSICRTHIP